MHLAEGVDRNARTAAPTLAVIISTLQAEAAPLTEPAFITPTNATQADIIPVIAKIKKYLLKGTALLTIDAAAQLVGGVLIVKHCLSLDIGEFFLAMRTLVPCSKWSPARPRHWPLVAEPEKSLSFWRPPIGYIGDTLPNNWLPRGDIPDS